VRFDGFSLVSLLIALALGVGLLAAAAELLVTSRTSQRWQAAAAQVEQAGELGLALIERELRAAGFTGGADRVEAMLTGPGCGADDGWALRPYPAVLIADGVGTALPVLNDGTSPVCLPSPYLASDSDLLVYRRAATLPSSGPGLADSRAPRATQWYLLTLAAGAGRMVYVENAPGSHLATLGGVAREWRTGIFYVRDYSSRPGDGVPALCAERLTGRAMRSECLVEGVEQMQVEVLLDRDGDGRVDESDASPTIADMSYATGIQVALVVRSLETLKPRARDLVLPLGSDEVRVPAGDPYLHRVFTRQVPLDNF